MERNREERRKAAEKKKRKAGDLIAKWGAGRLRIRRARQAAERLRIRRARQAAARREKKKRKGKKKGRRKGKKRAAMAAERKQAEVDAAHETWMKEEAPAQIAKFEAADPIRTLGSLNEARTGARELARRRSEPTFRLTPPPEYSRGSVWERAACAVGLRKNASSRALTDWYARGKPLRGGHRTKRRRKSRRGGRRRSTRRKRRLSTRRKRRRSTRRKHRS